LDPCGLGYGPVVDFCEHGSEFRIPWKAGSFLTNVATVCISGWNLLHRVNCSLCRTSKKNVQLLPS
jgi:hypothetical protein